MSTEETKEIVLPQEVAQGLIQILTRDEKAGLLLRGYFAGAGITGNATLSAEFKLIVVTPTIEVD